MVVQPLALAGQSAAAKLAAIRARVAVALDVQVTPSGAAPYIAFAILQKTTRRRNDFNIHG